MNLIDIYSDVRYNSYQHINHFLYQFLKEKNSVRFLERFYMHRPSINNINNLFLPKSNIKKSDYLSEGINIYNLPHIGSIFNKLNSIFVKKQLSILGNICITFVPSPALSSIFNQYPILIYYCVHDSLNQNYSHKVIDYEKELVRKADIVFCDNEFVINRLSSNFNNNYSSILKSDFSKFYLVPPPVPDIFFETQMKKAEYDFIYFGSLHKNIEISVFYELEKLGYKILIVSNEISLIKTHTQNITLKEGTVNLELLSDYIFLSKNILFPYKNSKFMETISPAKLNQSLATGKPIICSNNLLADTFNLIHYDEFIKNSNLLNSWENRSKDVLGFKNSILMKQIISKIDAIWSI